MEVSILGQLVQFGLAAVFGVLCGVFYDLLHLLGSFGRLRVFLHIVLDVVFWTLCFLGLIVYVMAFCGGELRLFQLCGIFCGLIVYAMLPRRGFAGLAQAVGRRFRRDATAARRRRAG